MLSFLTKAIVDIRVGSLPDHDENHHYCSHCGVTLLHGQAYTSCASSVDCAECEGDEKFCESCSERGAQCLDYLGLEFLGEKTYTSENLGDSRCSHNLFWSDSRRVIHLAESDSEDSESDAEESELSELSELDSE